MKIMNKVFLTFLLLTFIACKGKKANNDENVVENSAVNKAVEKEKSKPETPEGMVWIPGGSFTQGAYDNDNLALQHEKPAHPVSVDGFFIDITEVTNAQFKKFVEATGYVTVAERKIDWEEMKKQVPPGTPKPHDSILQPGSLLFKGTTYTVTNLDDFYQWWEWKVGADWRHPRGPGSSIEGKDNYPVVHIAYEDALAYCKWAGRRLPTESEWEYAAKGGKLNSKFSWGKDDEKLKSAANTWQGEFPKTNTEEDGFDRLAPVQSFSPNAFGLYDMAGNVWEWTQDWYNVNYYKELIVAGEVKNPKGADQPFNPRNPYAKEKVIKGGSFLCNESYCASYRNSARMASTEDSGMEHLGFRTVATPEMLK
ncbi:formylglycine-generating enzyme family protein [Zhouia amylolytica]|uniref:formylglycine-generating enzyme family protein n=1 Tax=Zhouia amylolytica TaxID=376730 RepID=UPI0020CF3D91|nr:formylglycine-generating enzyme family protein [Zhouia amylolytica]MCQ0110419.1 formylglycine-generating enzyme family protein [Zhouia amylolytica]